MRTPRGIDRCCVSRGGDLPPVVRGRRLVVRVTGPGMLVLGIGVGLFYSSITTVAVTALDPSQSSLAGGIVYMCQIAGGAVGLEPARRHQHRVQVDACLALVGFAVALRDALLLVAAAFALLVVRSVTRAQTVAPLRCRGAAVD
jgi:hypothetical protein